MNRFNIIDESREALLDRLYLIYKEMIGAISRVSTLGERFDLFDLSHTPLDIDELESALREFRMLCAEPRRWRWNDFPSTAHPQSRVFRGISLTDREWFLLQDYLEHDCAEFLTTIFPKKSYKMRVSTFLRDMPATIHDILQMRSFSRQ